MLAGRALIAFCSWAVTKLSPRDCQASISSLRAKGVSVGRIRYARVVLWNALNTAMRWREVSQNVATLVEVPRQTQRELRPWKP